VEQCLFCDNNTRSYVPATGTDFICGSCVQLLLHADAEDLRRSHKKAMNLGLTRKATAIESFVKIEIDKEEENGAREKTEQAVRGLGREGSMQTFRPSRSQGR
jgi:hypothetical protein